MVTMRLLMEEPPKTQEYVNHPEIYSRIETADEADEVKAFERNVPFLVENKDRISLMAGLSALRVTFITRLWHKRTDNAWRIGASMAESRKRFCLQVSLRRRCLCVLLFRRPTRRRGPRFHLLPRLRHVFCCSSDFAILICDQLWPRSRKLGPGLQPIR